MALVIKRKDFIPGSFSNLVNDLIGDLYHEGKKEQKESNGELKYFHPKTNVLERNNAYVIQLALPGWTKKEVEISLDNSILSIKGSKKSELNEKVTYHNYEFDFGQFEKRFQLPENYEPNIKAEMKNGVLEIEVDKPEEKDLKRTIVVK